MGAEGFRYDAAPARREAIRSRVHERGFCTVAELAGHLGDSEMTVRRDVRRLHKAGELRAVHGGVSLFQDTVAGAGFDARLHANTAAKRRVAAVAARLVADGDTIAVDAGTTAHALVTALPDSFTGSVVTHSIPVLQAMLGRPRARCVGLGGDLYAPSRAFVGPATVEATAGRRVRWCFLAAAAVDERGCYGVADLERPTKHALMEIADETVLLVDAEKFRHVAPVPLAPLDRLHAVVSDAEPAAPVRAALAAAGVRLLLPPSS